MKTIFLFTGLTIGGIFGFLMASERESGIPSTFQPTYNARYTSLEEFSEWPWPDSLDAMVAAPESHQVVFEDSVVRILQVLLDGEKTEPIHTHQWKSVMWFVQSATLRYYDYQVSNQKFLVKDSIEIGMIPAAALNHGDLVEPEGPHAIKNTGNQKGIAYRVEFKK